MNYGGLRLLEFGPNRFQFAQEFMQIFRFFISILLILLILRISKGQCFRKGWSVHEACMGWIMEYLISLITSEQILIRTRIHGDIQVFYFNFADFADFEDLNWPALREGCVCSC